MNGLGEMGHDTETLENVISVLLDCVEYYENKNNYDKVTGAVIQRLPNGDVSPVPDFGERAYIGLMEAMKLMKGDW